MSREGADSDVDRLDPAKAPKIAGSDGEAPRITKIDTGRWAFWTTVPGVLTGLATLLTAIGGFVVVLHGMGGKAGPGSVAETSPLTRDNGTAISAVPSPLATSFSSGAGGILAQSTLSMRVGDVANLEKGEVGSVYAPDLSFFYCSTSRCLIQSLSGFMTAADVSASKASCVAALHARNDETVDLTKLVVGSTLCTQTSGGHIARLQVTGLPGIGSVTFTFSYAVWR